MTAQRKTVKRVVEDMTIFSVELDFETATDLLPELLSVIGPGGGAAQFGISHIGEAIGMMATALCGGRLKALLPRILAGTTIVFAGDAKYELAKGWPALNAAFTGRKQYAIAPVKLALEVNFRDFLDGFALAGIQLPTASPIEDSNPSTSATG